MGIYTLKNSKLLVDGFDLSGKMNNISLGYASELQDDTVMGDTTRSRIGGLKTVALSAEGFVDHAVAPDDVDQVMYSRIGVADSVVTVVLEDDAEGNDAYTFQAVFADYTPGATVGDMMAFTVTAESSGGVDGLVKGTIMNSTARTTTADGAGIQVGAVLAAEFAYASMHVTAVSGTNPTLNVVIESDAGDTWSGAETSRFTFTEKDDVGSQWQTRVAGAITDSWWRATWAITGTDNPTFSFTVVLGIK